MSQSCRSLSARQSLKRARVGIERDDGRFASFAFITAFGRIGLQYPLCNAIWRAVNFSSGWLCRTSTTVF